MHTCSTGPVPVRVCEERGLPFKSQHARNASMCATLDLPSGSGLSFERTRTEHMHVCIAGSALPTLRLPTRLGPTVINLYVNSWCTGKHLAHYQTAVPRSSQLQLAGCPRRPRGDHGAQRTAPPACHVHHLDHRCASCVPAFGTPGRTNPTQSHSLIKDMSPFTRHTFTRSARRS